ncbi:MAG: insulinase family protein [Alphaproteobacteria bacterium]|nr:insulinase family protein [Alphaproteobacteria bacterium]
MRFFEQVQITVLDNGFTVVTDYFPGHPKAAASLVLASGGFHDPLDQLGCAHFMEHMLTHAHPEMNQLAFNRMLKRKAIRGNVTTGKDNIQAFAEARCDSVQEFMDVVARMFVSGSFTRPQVEHERQPIVDEMEEEHNSREQIATRARLKAIYGDAARATLPVGGDPEHLKRITYEQLQHFWHDNVVGKNMMYVSAGGISHEDNVVFCAQHFGHLKPGYRRPRFGGKLMMRDFKFPMPERQDDRVYMNIMFDASQAFANPMVKPKLELVESYFQTALSEDIRFRGGQLYDIGAQIVPFNNSTQGVLAIAANCHPDNYGKQLVAIRSSLHDIMGGDQRHREAFELSRESIGNIVAEHAADLAESMSMRRQRIIDSLLKVGKLPDVKAEQANLMATTFEEATAVIRDIIHACVPVVDHRGHIDDQQLTGAQMGKFLGLKGRALIPAGSAPRVAVA